MVHLFSPLTLGSHRLRNRIVRTPWAGSGENHHSGGFIAAHHIARYAAWAAGGVGLILTEPLLVVHSPDQPASGIYSDVFVPDLHRLCAAVGARSMVLPVLTYPALAQQAFTQVQVEQALQAYAAAAWRAVAAGFQGLMLDAGPQTLLYQSLSPRFNDRHDEYGSPQRIRFASELVEHLRARFGPKLLLGFRLVVDELRPDGLTLQESRVMARRLSACGVQLFDLLVGDEPTLPVAHFPGWQIPLASSLRAVLDVPVLVNDDFVDPEFANELIVEESIDLIGIAQPLMLNPHWPRMAAQTLQRNQAAS